MAAATAFLVAGTALTAGASLYGASAQSKALKQQGAYQKQISEQNARQNELFAADTIERGKEASTLVRKRALQLRGTQRASLAGQGVDVNRGTALRLQDEAYTMGELDAITVKNNAWREAWGYKTQAQNVRGEGRFAAMSAKSAARNTMLTGSLSAAGSIFKGTYEGMR